LNRRLHCGALNLRVAACLFPRVWHRQADITGAPSRACSRKRCPESLLNDNTFSGSLGLELVELEPCAGNHTRKIGRQHYHIEAALHCARCKRRAGTMHGGLDAVLVRGLPDLVAGREMDRVWIVAARYEPQRER